MIDIISIVNGGLFETCYFVHEKNSKNGFIVDPGYDVESIYAVIKKNSYIVDNILITHAHFDHILGSTDIIKDFGSKLYIPKKDLDILNDKDKNYAVMLRRNEVPTLTPDILLNDNDIIELNGIKVKCIESPGHTLGSMSYYLPDENVLFSGDTLFKNTYGKTTFFGGSIADMKNSILNKLFLLEENCVVYPGHGEPTTIKYEKENNMILEV